MKRNQLWSEFVSSERWASLWEALWELRRSLSHSCFSPNPASWWAVRQLRGSQGLCPSIPPLTIEDVSPPSCCGSRSLALGVGPPAPDRGSCRIESEMRTVRVTEKTDADLILARHSHPHTTHVSVPGARTRQSSGWVASKPAELGWTGSGGGEVLKENQGAGILISLYGSLCPSGREWQRAYSLAKASLSPLPHCVLLSSPHPVL